MPPRTFLELKPTTQSVLFGGRHIVISHLAHYLHVTPGHLSRVIHSERPASKKLLNKMALALRMTVSDVQAAILIASDAFDAKKRLKKSA